MAPHYLKTKKFASFGAMTQALLSLTMLGVMTVASILAKLVIQRATAPQLSRSELRVQYFCVL